MLASEASPSTDTVILARQALELGRQALVTGDATEAIRWLDRACRLAPHDRTLILPLATACLGRDDRRADALFRRVVATDDVREAWLGLAAACHHLGDAQGAADALGQALARHALDPHLLVGIDSLADSIAARADAAGWCGLAREERLILRGMIRDPVELQLDGEKRKGPGLPVGWQRARELAVLSGGRQLLGSPIRIAAIRRIAGYVEAHAGGLRGWAWHPGDTDTDPVLLIRPARGRGSLRVTAVDGSTGVQHSGPLARPRDFAVSGGALAGMTGPLHVQGRDGADLLGSPLDPRAEQAAATAAAAMLARLCAAAPAVRPRAIRAFLPPAVPADVEPPAATIGAKRRRPPVDVVIPVHGNAVTVLACLESVLATVRRPSRVLVVDDASPEPGLARALDALAADRRIRLLRNARNRGFPASANAGIVACAGRDVVLLNSDTLLPPNWLERLRVAAYAAPGIGTATPLSNHASILSYPGPYDTNAVPDLAATIRLDGFARRANARAVVDIPVAVGFCMYLRRDCIDAVGLFRADVFAQGYGEENDFCLRARHLGWRHVAVPGLFVAHEGAASFGQAGLYLKARNERLLNRLHPGYDRLVADFIRADPLAEPRRRIDLARWRAVAPRARESAILVTHTKGGGVERQVAAAAEAHRAAGRRVITLRPDRAIDGTPAAVIGDAAAGEFPNLRYALPAELPLLARVLRSARPRVVEIHHLLGHPPAVYDLIPRLGVSYEVHVHDYAWFCPRISLVDVERRYCGEPAVVRCEACVADAGQLIEEKIGVQALRERSDRFLSAARRVIAPSADAAARMCRHFPALRPVVVPHENDSGIADPPRPQGRSGRSRVCVVGAIGVHKGYDILLACARDAAERRLKLDFVVVGHTIDDARLLRTERVFITGAFQPDEAVTLIRAQNASLGFLPSVWPETWCFGLTELWRAGLSVVAFDFGAPAERIRRTGRGLLLPLGLPPSGINNALLAAVGLTGHEGLDIDSNPLQTPIHFPL